MLCDSPAEYRKYADIMEFLSAVPTVFDETKVLQAKANEVAVMVKRNEDVWFLGAMTNWTARVITIDFSFLPKGKWKAVLYKDGIGADVNAEAYEVTTQLVDQTSKINVRLAKGGGAVLHINRY